MYKYLYSYLLIHDKYITTPPLTSTTWVGMDYLTSISSFSVFILKQLLRLRNTYLLEVLKYIVELISWNNLSPPWYPELGILS